MLTPATLPASEFMKLALFTVVSCSLFTCCTLYDRAFSERRMPKAVTTTSASWRSSGFSEMVRFSPVAGTSAVV